MKIAVLTRRYGYNYGSSLQAYAMRLMLEGLGHEVTILNYDEFSQHLTWKIKPILRNVIIPLYCTIGSLGFKNKTFQNAIIEREQKKEFNKFDNIFINPTKKRLSSTIQLLNATTGKDVCICGSDQIWNPQFYDTHFFLDFCSKNKIKKIAYAPSFGVSNIYQHKDEIINLLNDFNFISIREKQGQKILQNLINKSCSVVLDPTLMIKTEIWRKVKDHTHLELPKRYIACYFLGHNYIPKDKIQSLSEQLNCKIINITTFRTPNDIEGIQLNKLSPLEFLDVIDNACCVITDSFHATVFSILFNTNFYSFNKHNNSDINNENSRLFSLLNLLNLESRLIDVNNKKIIFEAIHYENCNKRIDIERLNSYKFLSNALN